MKMGMCSRAVARFFVWVLLEKRYMNPACKKLEEPGGKEIHAQKAEFQLLIGSNSSDEIAKYISQYNLLCNNMSGTQRIWIFLIPLLARGRVGKRFKSINFDRQS